MKAPITDSSAIGSSRLIEAFTLIEVTLAIGVVAFAILTMVGLNSVGLTTLRSARDSAMEAQVVQAVGSEARLSDFSQLSTLAGTRYYDQEGRQVVAASASFAAVVSGPKALDTNAQTISTNHIQKLSVEFYRSPGGNFQQGQGSPAFISMRSVLVANSERDGTVGSP
ncbi:MAG: Verru_Chthon cassette protein B [Verrucomicrobiota bacterium]